MFFMTPPMLSLQLVGVWLIAQYQHARATMRKPEKVRLIELGPGRGTLMTDILSVSL